MIAKYNPTGIHLHKGILKVRIDFYPEPTDLSYEKYHYEVPDPESPEYKAGYPGKVDEFGNPTNQAQFNKWYNGLPKVWITAPFLCHFVRISHKVSKMELLTSLQTIFDLKTRQDLEATIVNNTGMVSQLLKDKHGASPTVISANFEEINTRLANLEVQF